MMRQITLDDMKIKKGEKKQPIENLDKTVKKVKVKKDSDEKE